VTYAGKSRAVLLALKDMLANVIGTQGVYIGIPEYYQTRVTASISVGARTPEYRATQFHETAIEYYVEFAYLIEGAEDTAEETLTDWLDGLEDAWLADRANGGTLNGLVRTWELDFSLQADPRFRRQAGDEVRLAPVLVRTFIPY
jgi:hypothetical protein